MLAKFGRKAADVLRDRESHRVLRRIGPADRGAGGETTLVWQDQFELAEHGLTVIASRDGTAFEPIVNALSTAISVLDGVFAAETAWVRRYAAMVEKAA